MALRGPTSTRPGYISGQPAPVTPPVVEEKKEVKPPTQKKTATSKKKYTK